MAIELYDDEKLTLVEQIPEIAELRSKLKKKVAFAIITFIVIAYSFSSHISQRAFAAISDDTDVCPIHTKRAPSSYYKDNATVEYIMKDAEFKKNSVEKLSGAIQVDTQVYDDAPEVSESPEYWEKFAAFHDYLEKTFPAVYKNLKVEKVNTYGLIYTWEGSDSSLKPLLLTAHQDTVPVQVETLGDWDYPPFEGHFDGTLLFGRGVGDCKNLLIGLLETVELFLKEEFSPKRTLVLAFGADEEIMGYHFAAKIGQFLEERYGPDSFYAIIDEGAGQLEKIGNLFLASPATAEKGYADIKFELTTPGGHSSVPPDHTSIGIMAELITLLESNPFEPILSSINPALEYSQCIARYSDSIDPVTRKSILRAGFDKIANSKAVEYFNNNIFLRYLIRTSQAIDVIRGGAKSNALPEHVSFTVNHRVSVESSTKEVYDRALKFVSQVAKKYDLGITIDGEKEISKPTKNGYFQIQINSRSEPTRVSPTSSDVWALYSGALRHLYEDLVFEGSLEKPVVVAPNVPTGNTDTKHYLNLSEHIYRSMPGWSEIPLFASGIHSVNERIDFNIHLQTIAFYYEYLQLVLAEEIE